MTSFNLLKLLSTVKAKSGGTSLVTLYIPANTSITQAINHLNSELSLAGNIKSKSVSKDVKSALCSGLYLLKNTSFEKHKTGPNGLVLCCGETLLYV